MIDAYDGMMFASLAVVRRVLKDRQLAVHRAIGDWWEVFVANGIFKGYTFEAQLSFFFDMRIQGDSHARSVFIMFHRSHWHTLRVGVILPFIDWLAKFRSYH